MGKTELAKWLLVIVFLSWCVAANKNGLLLLAILFLFILIYTRALRLRNSYDDLSRYVGHAVLIIATLFLLTANSYTRGAVARGFAFFDQPVPSLFGRVTINLNDYSSIPADLGDVLKIGGDYTSKVIAWQDARMATAQAQNSQGAFQQSPPAGAAVPVAAGSSLIHPSATYVAVAPSVAPTLPPVVVRPVTPTKLPARRPVFATSTPYAPPPVPTLAPPPTIDWQATAQAAQTQTPSVLPTVTPVPTSLVLPVVTPVPSAPSRSGLGDFVITARQGVVDAFDGTLNVRLVPVINQRTLVSSLPNGTRIIYLEVQNVPAVYTSTDAWGRERLQTNPSRLNTWGFILDAQGRSDVKGYLVCVTCQREQDPDGLVNQIQDLRITIDSESKIAGFFIYQVNGKTLMVRSFNPHWKPNFAEHRRMFQEQAGINRYNFVVIEYVDPGTGGDYETALTYKIPLGYKDPTGSEFSTAFGRTFTFLTGPHCGESRNPYDQSLHCQPATRGDEPFIELKQEHELAHLENKTEREDVEQDCTPVVAQLYHCDPSKGDYVRHGNPDVRKNFLQYDFIEYVP